MVHRQSYCSRVCHHHPTALFRWAFPWRCVVYRNWNLWSAASACSSSFSIPALPPPTGLWACNNNKPHLFNSVTVREVALAYFFWQRKKQYPRRPSQWQWWCLCSCHYLTQLPLSRAKVRLEEWRSHWCQSRTASAAAKAGLVTLA